MQNPGSDPDFIPVSGSCRVRVAEVCSMHQKCFVKCRLSGIENRQGAGPNVVTKVLVPMIAFSTGQSFRDRPKRQMGQTKMGRRE